MIGRYTLDDVDRKAWEAVLKRSEHATVFHALEWLAAVRKSFRTRETLLVQKRGGKPISVFPYFHSRKFSLDLYGSPLPETGAMYGGPVSVTGRPGSAMLEEFEKGRGARSTYFMKLVPGYPVQALRRSGYRIEQVPNIVLDLGRPVEGLWAGLNKKRRNVVRKAEKSGVAVVEGGLADVKEYHRMHAGTCKRYSLNPLSRAFLETVFEELSPKGRIKFLFAEHESARIAGAMFLLHQDRILYWMGDSLPEHLHLSPNDLMQWHIIKWGAENGYKWYDLGGADIPRIARFKSGWGGQETPFYRAYKGSAAANLARKLYTRARRYPLVSRLYRKGL